MDLELENWKPLRGQLLGRIIDGDYISSGGITIVASAKKKKPRKVEILKIGGMGLHKWGDLGYFTNSKGKEEHYRAYPGMTAWIKMAEGQKIRFNRQECLILENEDIVAVEINRPV